MKTKLTICIIMTALIITGMSGCSNNKTVKNTDMSKQEVTVTPTQEVIVTPTREVIVTPMQEGTATDEEDEIIEAGNEIHPELKAWYNKPATQWESEAIPIGNGFIGGMVFGGVDNDRIEINEHSIWSGGPGANSNYEGGANKDSATVQAALAELQELLQKEMSEFTLNNFASLDAKGSVIAKNYSNNAKIDALMNILKGEKNYYGTYQSLSNIFMKDLNFGTPIPLSASSTAEPLNGGECATNLFDGSNNKWYSGNSANGNNVAWPVTVTWMYSSAKEADSYSLTSANDVPGRDPKNWSFYGSDDGANYTLIDSQSDIVFKGRFQTITFPLTNMVSYKYYKLEITKTLEGNPPQLSEISLKSPAEQPIPYSNYTRTLDLNTATVTVQYDLDGITFTKEYFVSNPDNVMVIKLTASKAGTLNRQFIVTSDHTNKKIYTEGDSIYLTGQPTGHGENGLKFAQQVKVINKGGTLNAVDGTIEVKGADSILIIMSADTNYKQCADNTYNYFSEDDPLGLVIAKVTAAQNKGYSRLLQSHLDDYQELFFRVNVNFGSSGLPDRSTDELLKNYGKTNIEEENRYLEMLYYQFGRYLLIASSREGSLPANLQGLWSDGLSAPWDADYHTNINIQMNYWLAEQTNLAECHTAVIDYINSLVPRGTETAQCYYGEDSRGWTTFHENNIWGNTYPAVSDAFWFPTAAAWLCLDIWDYYQYNMDEEFLADNYDTMLNAALFWVDNLWEDERDHTLVTNPSYSPEHGEYSLGCSCDQAIIWELFHSVIEGAKVLGINTPEIAEVQDSMNRLYLPKIGLSGTYLEWKDETLMDITGDNGHRHVNQLFSLHPGTLVVKGRSDKDNQYADAMKKALTIRGDGGTGWSKAWKINMWARLRDGDHAGIMVNQILKESTLSNLFDTHPPFQIDGNFGATAGMTEMLIQSQGDSIDLMAAIPSMWNNGYAYGLKARKNFEISIDWTDRRLQNASITSLSGSKCILCYSKISGAIIKAESTGEPVLFQVINDNKISFDTVTGETYEITNIPRE